MTAAIDEGEQALVRRGLVAIDEWRARPPCRFTPRCAELSAKSVAVNEANTVRVVLDGRDIEGRSLTLTPVIAGAKVVHWRCSSDVEPQRWLPSACREPKTS